MRLTTVILIASLVQVSAASFGQRITLKKTNVSIFSVLKDIRKQSGFDFYYDKKTIPPSQKVSISVSDATLEETLNTAFKNLELKYEIAGKIVTISRNESFIETVKEKITDYFRADTVQFKGKVLDENGQPMSGASVKLKGKSRVFITGGDGLFAFRTHRKDAVIISYIGYITKEISLAGRDNDQPITITMSPGQEQLGEVNVVSTGYQTLPKERATGSFEVITSEMLKHSNDPNLLKRLEGLTTSMDFRNDLRFTNSASAPSSSVFGQIGPRASPLLGLTIRGKNSLTQNPITDVTNGSGITGQVLVVIDGVPAPYTIGERHYIDQINPEDVDNITILKDAAAASIWGSRAANGVIVITTKKGKFNTPTSIYVNSNVNITEKLDLFYKPRMSVSDYIDNQIVRFNKQYSMPYNPGNGATFVPAPSLTSNSHYFLAENRFITPLDDILNRQRIGQISPAQAEAEINVLRGNDVRRDFTDHFLQNRVNQNYYISISSGGQRMANRFSGGYINNIGNTKGSSDERYNIGYSTSIKTIKNLDLNASLNYSLFLTDDQAPFNRINAESSNSIFFPYERLTDNQGNPVATSKLYSLAFANLIKSTYGNRLLDPTYVPLNDINEGYLKSKTENTALNISTAYGAGKTISFTLNYNANLGRGYSNTLYGENSFYIRELYNRYTTISGASTTYNLPKGGLYFTDQNKQEDHNLSARLIINKDFKGGHNFAALAGADLSHTYFLTNSNVYPGYDEKTLNSTRILDFNTYYLGPYAEENGYMDNLLPSNYQPPISFAEFRNRAIGVFANAAYTYGNKYTLTATLRRDASSLFGQGANKWGTPFWSVGAKWSLDKEKFYNFAFLPALSLRGSFGYNGNVNPLVTAFPQLVKSSFNSTVGVPFVSTNSFVYNPLLRPEKTGTYNIGLDFGFKDNKISGSIQYYDKKTTDVLAGNPLDPSTGFASATYNTSNLHGWGWEVNLNSINFQSAGFSWNTNFNFAYNRVKVTKLFNPNKSGALAQSDYLSTLAYIEGEYMNKLFSFKWAGLDPETGDPRGYLNGNIISMRATDNTNYLALQAIDPRIDKSSFKIFGSAIPVYYGSLRNNFNYRQFSLSAMLMYKLGYYMRRPSSDVLSSRALISTRALGAAEYAQRWQKPGDELTTNVPSVSSIGNERRDLFYYYSDINVLKGDHVRLQEITLSYGLKLNKSFIKNPRIGANVTNLGVVWRANKLGLDPDIRDYPNPRTYSFSLSANF